jgi:anti-sigma B factor antagonist
MQTAPADGQQRVALQRDGARGRARGEPMEIAQHNAGKVMVAKMSDPRVDARLAGEFRRHLLDLIESGHPLIALDLSEVDFIDSSGLGAIVSALKQLKGRGDLVIVGARPEVLNLFRLTRMDKVFRMFPRADDAVAALSN